jgi:hypothetical protein
VNQQNYVNHVGMVIDSSGSMAKHRNAVVAVADDQIRYLARRSRELDQETRVTVYSFADQAKCLIYDMDVLRLPSIATLYQVGGNTALIDATILSQKDLAMTPEKYGNHSFLTFVLTDGEENRSQARSFELNKLLTTQPEHWTVAALVPDMRGKAEAKRFGFPADNIAIWDTSSDSGVCEAGDTITAALENYMTGRTRGIRGTRSVFSTGKEAVNKETIAASGLRPLSQDAYLLVPVPRDTPIKEFVESTGRTYKTGSGFYALTKSELIQANKIIAVVENKTAKVFLGPDARSLIGLPDMEVRVRPGYNPDYTIYVQSTSINRKLIAGTKLLMIV